MLSRTLLASTTRQNLAILSTSFTSSAFYTFNKGSISHRTRHHHHHQPLQQQQQQQSPRSFSYSTMANTPKSPSLVWIDCEMTGLLETDKLIEIAVMITDDDLNIVAEGPNLIIHQPKSIMDGMNAWCVDHHGRSGLTASVLASTISTAEASRQVLEFIQKYIPQPRVGILAGNSVHADKVFLEREMKEIVEHLHYRIVDVSTVKELSRRWFPKEFEAAPRKEGAHRALEDIRESIEELKYYRTAVFKQ